MPKITKNRIIWDEEDWLAGMNPFWNTAPYYTQKMKGIGYSSRVDPFREPGYIAPAYDINSVINESSISNVLTNAISYGDFSYVIGDGNQIHKVRNINAEFEATANRTIGTIHGTHSGAKTKDIAIYKANSGGTLKTFLFYSYSDNGGDGDIGRLDLGAGTYIDDFMSTTPSGGAVLDNGNLFGIADMPHPLHVGLDDILYIGDGSNIHAYDGQAGADGTFYKNVLKLPSDYVITCMANYGEFVAIGAYKNRGSSTAYYRGEAKVFFWNVNEKDITFMKDLNDSVVSEIMNYNGTLIAFTEGVVYLQNSGKTKNAKLQILGNNFEFEILEKFPGTPPMRGSVDILAKFIQFNSDGVLYSWGSPYEEFSSRLNIINEPIGSSTGLVRTLSSGVTLISSGSSANSGAGQVIQAGTYNDFCSFTPQIADIPFPENQMGRVKNVRIEFLRSASGGRAFGLIIYDRFGNNSTIIAEDLENISSKAIEYKLDVNDNEVFNFVSLVPSLRWQTGSGNSDAPIISRIIIDYDTINL
ncbi:hypothetical protein [Persephonella sp.]